MKEFPKSKTKRQTSHLDTWAELLKDPKVREEWEQLKKEVKKYDIHKGKKTEERKEEETKI